LLDADAARRFGQMKAVHPLWPQTTDWALQQAKAMQLIAKIRPWRGTAGVYPLAIPFPAEATED